MAAIEEALSARQRGDFQTPEELARKVWGTIDVSQYDLIVEPTFGLGSFLKTIPDSYRGYVVGWEIEKEYCEVTRAKLAKRNLPYHVQLTHNDVFELRRTHFPTGTEARVLVIGNPPWVTNAEQSTMGGKNTGKKRNLKSLNGLHALTGKANFDISEAIILHLANLLKNCRLAQFALLGKFTVLRNLIQFIGPSPYVGDFEYHRIDSAKHFGAAVDAGLIKFKVGEGIGPARTCRVHESIDSETVREIAIINNHLIHDVTSYTHTSFMEHRGLRHYVWRQGIKHDLRDILELIETEQGLKNRLGEVVDVEPEIIYQLYKSSDLFHGRRPRYVIPIYQNDLKDNLEDLPHRYPRLYQYLLRHQAAFEGRKSKIYKKRNVFTVFGVGDYTHFRYKVAIGAMYTHPNFRLLEPAPRPAAVDDTCYILATNDYTEAVYLLAVLSLQSTKDYLLSISHPHDKRRFSKEILDRVIVPPQNDCPERMRNDLLASWLAERAFPLEVQERLVEWLQAYEPEPEPEIAYHSASDRSVWIESS